MPSVLGLAFIEGVHFIIIFNTSLIKCGPKTERV